MCYRYTITVLPSDLELWLNIKSPNTYKPRFNAAPSQYLPIVANNNTREVIMGRWGFLPNMSSSSEISPKLFSKSLDSIKSSKIWSQSLQTNRCLILADGFYCWKLIGKNRKVPYRVIPKHKKLICFAGIWEEYSDLDKNTHLISFMLITRPSFKPVNEISETMPVIIESGKEMLWLEGKNLSIEDLISTMEIEDWALLEYYSVSPSVEKSEIDKPELIRPAPATDQHGNLTLFD